MKKSWPTEASHQSTVVRTAEKRNDVAETFELIRPTDRRTKTEIAVAVKYAGHSEGRRLNEEYEHQAE
jgi:hypothetical protein